MNFSSISKLKKKNFKQIIILCEVQHRVAALVYFSGAVVLGILRSSLS